MTGRFTQLGRQLRKLRHIIGRSPSASPVTTLRRATQLACELACEAAAVEDAQAAFHDLAGRGIVEATLAERLAALAAVSAQRDDSVADRAALIGRDLDTLLRSLEHGAPAPELPFEAIVARDPVEGTASTDTTSGVPISGRILAIAVRDGIAMITIDEQPVAMAVGSGQVVPSFPLTAAPTTTPEVTYDPGGVTRLVWGPENLSVEVAEDFQRARVETTAL